MGKARLGPYETANAWITLVKIEPWNGPAHCPATMRVLLQDALLELMKALPANPNTREAVQAAQRGVDRCVTCFFHRCTTSLLDGLLHPQKLAGRNMTRYKLWEEMSRYLPKGSAGSILAGLALGIGVEQVFLKPGWFPIPRDIKTDDCEIALWLLKDTLTAGGFNQLPKSRPAHYWSPPLTISAIKAGQDLLATWRGTDPIKRPPNWPPIGSLGELAARLAMFHIYLDELNSCIDNAASRILANSPAPI